VAYIEQSISNIARLLESPLGLKDGMDAAFEWLLQKPDALIDRSSNEEETLTEKGSVSVEGPHPRTTTTQVIEDEYAFSLMDIASSTALGADAVGKEIIDSPGTVRIISALRGRGLVSPDLQSGTDPTEEALSGRDPVSGREEEEEAAVETRPQRSVVFRSVLEERNPMLEQLQR